MNSQERLLNIFLRLLDGEVLTKKDLMVDYNKQSATIQRDISLINEVLEQRAEDAYFTKKDGEASLYEEYMEEHTIDRQHKGRYQLKKFANQALNSSNFSNEEVLILLKVLLASRCLEEAEMELLCKKVTNLAEDEKQINYLIGNEQIYYQGVPKEAVFSKVRLLSECVLQQQEISFTYEKLGQVEHYKRVPAGIFFSDLYLYILTAKETSQDDADLEHLNKFRINNMKDIKVLPIHHKVNYSERFEGGKWRKQTNLPFFGNPITMVIDFFWDPVYVLDRFPDSKILSQKDGVYRIEMQVNDGYGMKMWLLSQGDMVKVISPNHMKDYIVNDMKDALKYYGYEVVKKEDLWN